MIQINMSMPKSCWNCKVEQLTRDCPCNLGYADSIDYKDKRHPDCPLQEEPNAVSQEILEDIKAEIKETLDADWSYELYQALRIIDWHMSGKGNHADS